MICGMLAKQGWGRVLVMPNTKPAITSIKQALDYGYALCKMLGSSGVSPLMTMELNKETVVGDLGDCSQTCLSGLKTYPKNMTTNSEHGVYDYTKLYPVLEVMQEHGIPWLVHPEHPAEEIEGLEKELRFITEVLMPARRKFPNLRIVVEHVTSHDMVDWVCRQDEHVVATITAHHLVLTLDSVIGYSRDFDYLMAPHNMCKPVAKHLRDKVALISAATSGSSKFFFGSDSAAHYRDNKEAAGCCAGCFTLPVALPVLARVFEANGSLNRLQDFVSRFGAEFYGLPLNEGKVTLVKEEWEVPKEIPVPSASDVVVPWLAGKKLSWKLKPSV